MSYIWLRFSSAFPAFAIAICFEKRDLPVFRLVLVADKYVPKMVPNGSLFTNLIKIVKNWQIYPNPRAQACRARNRSKNPFFRARWGIGGLCSKTCKKVVFYTRILHESSPLDFDGAWFRSNSIDFRWILVKSSMADHLPWNRPKSTEIDRFWRNLIKFHFCIFGPFLVRTIVTPYVWPPKKAYLVFLKGFIEKLDFIKFDV